MSHAMTIQQMIEQHSTIAPKDIAIVDGAETMTYHAFNQQANQLAHYLRQFNIQPNELVAVSCESGTALLIAITAILKTGGAYLPTDARHPVQRLHYILEDTNARVLLTQRHLLERFNTFKGRIILLDECAQLTSDCPTENPECITQPEHLAYGIYTSGSSGKPKAVLIEQRTVLNYIAWFQQYSRCQPQERIDFSSSIIFDMAVTTTITALASGLQVVICRSTIKQNVSEYLQYLQVQRINLCKLTPSYFKILIDAAENAHITLPDLRLVILGGEILLSKECSAWLAMYPQHEIVNEYGPTETTVAVTAFHVTNKNVARLAEIVPIGKPAAHVECHIKTTEGIDAAAGEKGELYVGGECLARGYLHQDALTQERFVSVHHGRYYRTGDYCRYLADGNIEYLSRLDNQVKIRGFRVEPGEVEAVLQTHPLIKQACVVAREQSQQEYQLVGYYLPTHAGIAIDKTALKHFLQQTLADYMIPSTFIMLSSFPLTQNGKLDIKALPYQMEDVEQQEPETALERQLILIWQKVFRQSSINLNSHFFALGGHSLIAARMIVEIEKTLGKHIKLNLIYQFPTVRELAHAIALTEKTSIVGWVEQSDTQQHLQTKHIPLSDFQFIFWISHLFEPKLKQLSIIARRRVMGKLNDEVLALALDWVIRKHPILTAGVQHYAPRLTLQQHKHIDMTVTDISTEPCQEAEMQLHLSLDELLQRPVWQQKTNPVALRLFYLPNKVTEIQLSVAHIVFDDASEAIFFADLSAAYVHYLKYACMPGLTKQIGYREYVAYEREHLNKHLKRDIDFWKQYLQDTSLVHIPEEHIVTNMISARYSTYLPLPPSFMDNVSRLCSKSAISITDLLCAALALTLKKYAKQSKQHALINIIRSVRNNEQHEKMIGCFLRLDPVKINVHAALGLIGFAKSIQHARLETEPYQNCSSMVKNACLDKSYRRKFVRNMVISVATSIYCMLFSKLQMKPAVLNMYSRLKSLRNDRQFIININLLHNFIDPNQDKVLFGHDLVKTNAHQYDLSIIDSVLDISLMRNENTNQLYLVISGNLKPAFREAFGKYMIQHISQTEGALSAPAM